MFLVSYGLCLLWCHFYCITLMISFFYGILFNGGYKERMRIGRQMYEQIRSETGGEIDDTLSSFLVLKRKSYFLDIPSVELCISVENGDLFRLSSFWGTPAWYDLVAFMRSVAMTEIDGKVYRMSLCGDCWIKV